VASSLSSSYGNSGISNHMMSAGYRSLPTAARRPKPNEIRVSSNGKANGGAMNGKRQCHGNTSGEVDSDDDTVSEGDYETTEEEEHAAGLEEGGDGDGEENYYWY